MIKFYTYKNANHLIALLRLAVVYVPMVTLFWLCDKKDETFCISGLVLLFPALFLLNWIATVGLNKVLYKTQRGTIYLNDVSAWVLKQQSALKIRGEKTAVYADWGEACGAILVRFGLLIWVLAISAILTECFSHK